MKIRHPTFLMLFLMVSIVMCELFLSLWVRLQLTVSQFVAVNLYYLIISSDTTEPIRTRHRRNNTCEDLYKNSSWSSQKKNLKKTQKLVLLEPKYCMNYKVSVISFLYNMDCMLKWKSFYNTFCSPWLKFFICHKKSFFPHSTRSRLYLLVFYCMIAYSLH